jgi:hypothetical protein
VDRARPITWIALAVVAAATAVGTACAAPGEDAESSEAAVAVAGRWTLPADVETAGAGVRLTYDGAPRWTGTGACAGRAMTGTRKLGLFLSEKFPEVSSVGGYACRRNTADGSRMSVHGTGRAMDVFIPTTGGQADNSRGDKVANWLVEHASEIGIQLIIWDRSVWRGNGTNDTAYGGPHPHDDHLHVELTLDAGNAKTTWFSTMSMDAADDDDGGAAETDAGEDPDLGDGGLDDDAGADAGKVDAGADAGKVDAGKVDAGKVDAAAPPPSAPSDWEIEEGEDDPGEKESITKTRPTSKRSGASDDGDTLASKGCSAAPMSRATSRAAGGDGAILFVALGALVMGARRRRTR